MTLQPITRLERKLVLQPNSSTRHMTYNNNRLGLYGAFKSPKAPDRVPGSIIYTQSRWWWCTTIIATAALGQTDRSMAAIQRLRALRPPPQTYSSHTHEARWVKCLAQGHSNHETIGRGGIEPPTRRI